MKTTILILIFYLQIWATFQTRLLKEENNSDEKGEDQKSCEEETEKKEEEIDFSKISPSKIRKENMPHSQVLLPIRRIGTSNMQMGNGPCGGVEKKSANTLTTKGSSINFVWEILVPENSGNCTVKISNGKQDINEFQLLKPVDNNINEDGSFECGREKGFEQKEFVLPENYECDGCTLQWKWTTSYGDIYSCSDIVINGGSLSKCMGKCLNGGSCFNGKCLCTNGFSGEFCEDDNKGASLTFLWVILGILAAGGLGYLIYKFLPDIKRKFSQGWTLPRGIEAEDPIPENSSKRNIPEYEPNNE